MYLAPRTGVPHSNAGVFRDVTYRRVLVLLGRIALVIVHFGHSVVLCRAAKDSASLNSNSAIRRTLTRHRHKVKIFNLRKKKWSCCCCCYITPLWSEPTVLASSGVGACAIGFRFTIVVTELVGVDLTFCSAALNFARLQFQSAIVLTLTKHESK